MRCGKSVERLMRIIKYLKNYYMLKWHAAEYCISVNHYGTLDRAGVSYGSWRRAYASSVRLDDWRKGLDAFIERIEESERI